MTKKETQKTNAIIIISVLIFPLTVFGMEIENNNLGNFESSKSSKILEINPEKALKGIPNPLSSIWEAFSDKINFNIPLFGDIPKEASKSLTDASLASESTQSTFGEGIDTRKVIEITKKILIIGAQVFIVVLELALWVIKGMLGAIK